jgi:thiamine biosynthesis lipoprotein
MRGLIALGLTALVLTSCRPADDALVTHRLLVMATWVDIRLPQEATQRDPGLIRLIDDELRAFERDYYAWGDGQLAAMNRSLSETGAFESSADLAELLRRAQSIAAVTNGAFDPGIGALVELWGFNSGERNDTGGEPQAGPPTDSEIADRLQTSGSIRDLKIDGRRITAPAARYTIDLGGIAKGAAVDRIIDLLRAHDVALALVNAGGDLGVIGHPSDRPWRIGIQAPRGEGMLGAIELNAGEFAFTSGDYERYFELAGSRLHHIIDPRTGVPASHTQAITVVTDDGTVADAAATALFVAGPMAWRSMARALGIEAVLRVDASGAIEMTAAMRDRFAPNAQVTSDIIAAAD